MGVPEVGLEEVVTRQDDRVLIVQRHCFEREAQVTDGAQAAPIRRRFVVQEREGENSGLHVIVVRPASVDGAADKRREGVVRTTSAN